MRHPVFSTIHEYTRACAQEPYELPVCRLAVLDAAAGQVVPLSPLDLFADAAEAAAVLAANPRARVLLLRHFSPRQANRLLGIGGSGGNGPAVGDEDGDGADLDGGAEDWELLGEVRARKSVCGTINLK